MRGPRSTSRLEARISGTVRSPPRRPKLREAGAKRAQVTDPLRVLLVEDSENDAMLLLRELRRGGYQLHAQRVCTPEDMQEALRAAEAKGEPFHVVISDYYMPRFSAPDALRLLRELGCDVPFIVVSGKIGEDAAVGIMKAGANDYLTKENMSRLCPAIEREVREAEVRREREKALDLSEDRFSRLVEQIPAVTYVQEPIDSDTPKAITYMSPQYEAMFGYPPETEILDEEAWLRMLHPDDRERVLAEELRTDETGEPFRIEYRQIARDGRVVWVRDEATLVSDEDGNPLYWLGVQYDITEQKRTEEELRRSEERFRATFEQAAVGIVQVGLDGEWLRVNDKFCNIIGYEREELEAVSVFHLISPEDSEKDLDVGVRMLAGEFRDYTEEKLIVGKEGKRVWINLTVSLVHDDSDEPRYFIAVAEDIGKRKQAEEDLRLRDRAVAASSNGIVITDPNLPDNPIVYVNPAFEKTTGYTLKEAIGRNCRFLQGEDRDQPAIKDLRACIREGQECRVVLRNYRRDGTRFWNELYVSPVHDDAGNVINFVGGQNDITESKRAQEVLKGSEDRLRLAVESTGLGTWDWNLITGGL